MKRLFSKSLENFRSIKYHEWNELREIADVWKGKIWVELREAKGRIWRLLALIFFNHHWKLIGYFFFFNWIMIYLVNFLFFPFLIDLFLLLFDLILLAQSLIQNSVFSLVQFLCLWLSHPQIFNLSFNLFFWELFPPEFFHNFSFSPVRS